MWQSIIAVTLLNYFNQVTKAVIAYFFIFQNPTKVVKPVSYNHWTYYVVVLETPRDTKENDVLQAIP